MRKSIRSATATGRARQRAIREAYRLAESAFSFWEKTSYPDLLLEEGGDEKGADALLREAKAEADRLWAEADLILSPFGLRIGFGIRRDEAGSSHLIAGYGVIDPNTRCGTARGALPRRLSPAYC